MKGVSGPDDFHTIIHNLYN